MNLDELKLLASTCTNCELHAGRIKPVFDKGNPNTRLFICGMVPAKEENYSGIPFYGKAGKLLDVILEQTGLTLESVYITNLVKCLLAAGKKLDQSCIDNCIPYLINQIVLIMPKVIIALGKDATVGLIGPIDSMKAVVGKPQKYLNDIIVLPTYHPSYLLRAGGEKHKDFGEVIGNFRMAKTLAGI